MRWHYHCGHRCPQLCWEDCGNCQVRITSVKLPCGHTARNLMCHETIDLTKIICQRKACRYGVNRAEDVERVFGMLTI
jgi:hypothetical protein